MSFIRIINAENDSPTASRPLIEGRRRSAFAVLRRSPNRSLVRRTITRKGEMAMGAKNGYNGSDDGDTVSNKKRKGES